MSPIPSISSTAATNASTAVSATSASADQNMFLQLLVAQLQNQDPTQPMDSTTFVTQLAQFQQLESTNNMATSVSGIQSDTDQLVTDFGSSAGTAANGSNSTTQS
jgi:flagellar hook assembly protein FlgD